MPRDCLSDTEEAIDVWPRGGCWLQDEACQVSVGRVSQSIGGGLPSQQHPKGFKLFMGVQACRLEGLRAGKRQAWTPIRSMDVWPWGACWLQDEACQWIGKPPKKPWMCGLGQPVGCRMKHAKGLFKRPRTSHWMLHPAANRHPKACWVA